MVHFILENARSLTRFEFDADLQGFIGCERGPDLVVNPLLFAAGLWCILLRSKDVCLSRHDGMGRWRGMRRGCPQSKIITHYL